MTGNENFISHCVCCGFELPVVDERVPPEVAELVRSLRRQAKPIEAVKELRRLTELSLSEAKFWADHSGEPIGRAIVTGPCPFCGKELRTADAKQCRHCLKDWHDPNELRLLKTVSQL
jgi:hypothetical protein